MADEAITVRCACGWETTGPEADVVTATTEHGRRLHNMTATRDEVLAMAVDGSRVPDSRASPPAPGEPGSSGLPRARGS